MVEAILCRLKAGYQWRQLPMKQFFRVKCHWQSVYHHFHKWCKDGSWEKGWRCILEKHKDLLDMSSIQLDGAHTLSKRGGQAAGYQGKKRVKPAICLS
ncbi:MAG: transposase [Bacteroidetes bacterium]|nr:transposase [Bacteroidota bacterium]